VFVIMATGLAVVPVQVSVASADACPDLGVTWTIRTSAADK
jgi:hypothetical protein